MKFFKPNGIIFLILIIQILLLSGCITCGPGISKQEQAINQKDFTICNKASLPDVCLLGYARELKDNSPCGYIKDENMKNNCFSTSCGNIGGVCCSNGYSACNTGSCHDGICVSCGLDGQAACLDETTGVYTCFDGTKLTDNQFCRECGGLGIECCNDICNDGLSICLSGTCVTCGHNGERCCANNFCGAGKCINNMCINCGQEGKQCCNNECNYGLFCNNNNICAKDVSNSDNMIN